MKLDQIALITYTIRDHCKDEDDFARSMERVASIGYPAVQISGIGPIPAERVKSICDQHGLAICATHEPGDQIIDSPQAVADRLDALGTTHTAYPFPNVPIGTVDEVRALCAGLDKAGEVLRGRGKTLSYHNHNNELIRLENGGTPLDMIYGETSPTNLAGEIDTYWIQAGGASPLSWIKRLKGRLPLLHLKDAAVFVDKDSRHLRFASIGDGNLEWDNLISAADEAGTEWFIVEQDGDWAENDPFVAAERSYNYLSKNHVE